MADQPVNDPEKARAIYEAILRDYEAGAAQREQIMRGLQEKIFGAARNAQIPQPAAPPAPSPSAGTNMLDQLVCEMHLNIPGVTPQAQAAQPAAPFQPPAAAAVQPAQLSPQFLTGIWDAYLSNGRQAELAMDGGSYSYCATDGAYAFWGSWTLSATPGGPAYLSLARKGNYPAAFYGPYGTQANAYPPSETWGITAFSPGRISIGPDSMIQRGAVPLPLVTARISQVIAEFSQAEIRNQNNAAFNSQQIKAVNDVQSALGQYIDSGLGRPKF